METMNNYNGVILTVDLESRECNNEDLTEELVEKARGKITLDEARDLILARWKETLRTTIMTYVADYQREFLSRLENLWEKYTITVNEILAEREKASEELNRFLGELGYE